MKKIILISVAVLSVLAFYFFFFKKNEDQLLPGTNSNAEDAKDIITGKKTNANQRAKLKNTVVEKALNIATKKRSSAKGDERPPIYQFWTDEGQWQTIPEIDWFAMRSALSGTLDGAQRFRIK